MKINYLFFLFIFSFYSSFPESKATSIVGGEMDFVEIKKLIDTMNMQQHSNIVLNVNVDQIYFDRINANWLQMDGIFVYIKTDNPQVEIDEVRDLSTNALFIAKGQGIYMIARLEHQSSNAGKKELSITFKYNCKAIQNSQMAKMEVYLVPSADTTFRFESPGIPQQLFKEWDVAVPESGYNVFYTSTILNYSKTDCPENVDSTIPSTVITEGEDSVHVTDSVFSIPLDSITLVAPNSSFSTTIVTNADNGASVTAIYDSQEKSECHVYPNPTTGIFNIDILQGQQIGYELTDPTGNIIMKESNIDNHTLDIRSFPSGVYYIHIFCNNRSIHTKIIKN